MLPPVIFKNVFDAYNFSMIYKLFDSNNNITLTPQARMITNVRAKCIVGYLAKHSELGIKYLNLPENYSKITKIAITARNFLNFFRGSIPPPDPRELFLFLNQLQICFAEKKIRLKKCGNNAPPPLLQNFSLRHWMQVCRYQQILMKEMLQ